MSSSSGTCAECGSPIPEDAFGHCPRCLFALTGRAEADEDALECFRAVMADFPEFEFEQDHQRLSESGFAWRGRVRDGGMSVVLRLRDAADEATAPLEECRRRARLDDPDIAKMHVCGEHGRFVYTVVSEPPGDSLSQAMHEGRLSRPQVDRIFRKVREAWNRACKQGVTLGTSPGNIILRAENGLPVLTGLDLRKGAASEPDPPA